eukprot:g77285.t1
MAELQAQNLFHFPGLSTIFNGFSGGHTSQKSACRVRKRGGKERRIPILPMSSTSEAQRSTSQQLATQPSANTGRVVLSIDVWRLIRDCIGWSELLPVMRQFDLSWCQQITDAGLADLSALCLQELNLARCHKVTDAGLAHLTTLPLKNLKLDYTNIKDAGLAHLAAFPLQSLPLKHLDLGCMDITDAAPQYLLLLQNHACWAILAALPLKHLYLGYTLITDAGLAHLTALPLQRLILPKHVFTEAAVPHLTALPLQHLKLTYTDSNSDAAITSSLALPLWSWRNLMD